ncbi:MAG TPA: hypothetical protein VF407_20765 [Polyangiaceae bacterium]
MASFTYSIRAAASLAALTAVTIFGATTMVTGCSDDSPGETPDAAAGSCPTSLGETIGQACVANGPQTCSITYLCGDFLAETATCNCQGGTWGCVDGTGTAIDDAANVKCTNPGPGNDKQCPSDEKNADNASCATPGLVCNYTGATCEGATAPNIDQCQCVGNDADGGLVLRCEPAACPGPIPDAGGISDSGGIKVDASGG